jgi:hypothetical protein
MATAPTPTRYLSGVSSRKSGALKNWGFLDPSMWFTYFSDFLTYVASEWTVTETQAGATQALAAGVGGQLVLTNTDADNDVVQLQGAAAFNLSGSAPCVFSSKFKASDVVESDIFVGLMITDTSPIDATDGIYFYKADGAAALVLRINKNSTVTDVACGNMVADTFIEAEFFYNGKDGIEVFIDGVAIYNAPLTNLPNDENLALTLSLMNGEAVAGKTLTVDWVLGSQYRG